METVFIRITIPNTSLAEVVELKEVIDKLVEHYPNGTVELSIIRRPERPYPPLSPSPPGG